MKHLLRIFAIVIITITFSINFSNTKAQQDVLMEYIDDGEYGMSTYRCSCNLNVMRCIHRGGGCCVGCQPLCSEWCAGH